MAAEMAVSAEAGHTGSSGCDGCGGSDHKTERRHVLIGVRVCRSGACCLGNRWLCRQLLEQAFRPSICSSAGALTAPITVLPRSSPLANA